MFLSVFSLFELQYPIFPPPTFASCSEMDEEQEAIQRIRCLSPHSAAEAVEEARTNGIHGLGVLILLTLPLLHTRTRT